MSEQVSRIIANKRLNTINTKFSCARKREREMEKKEKGNSSKFLVVDSLLPSIVDKEKKKKGSAKIENEKRKWTGTGSEQAGEEKGRRKA